MRAIMLTKAMTFRELEAEFATWSGVHGHEPDLILCHRDLAYVHGAGMSVGGEHDDRVMYRGITLVDMAELKELYEDMVEPCKRRRR